jgi:nucleoid DNA-binding protein
MYHLRTVMLIHEVAKNNGITKEEAENIITTMFEAIRYFQSRAENRETEHFPIIRVPGFAKFYPAKRYLENLKKKEENESI